MNKNPREASIVKSILTWIKSVPHSWAMKTYGDSRRAGLPDIIGAIDGRFFGIEVKQPGKDATTLQSATLASMARAGAIVGVAHSRDEAREILAPLVGEYNVKSDNSNQTLDCSF